MYPDVTDNTTQASARSAVARSTEFRVGRAQPRYWSTSHAQWLISPLIARFMGPHPWFNFNIHDLTLTIAPLTLGMGGEIYSVILRVFN